MKTLINIGTSRGNMAGVEINKPFNDIRYVDVLTIVESKFGNDNSIRVHGWAEVKEEDEQGRC